MSRPSVRTEYAKRLSALYLCIKQLQRQRNFKSLASTAIEFLQDAFQIDLIWIARYDVDSRCLINIGGHLTGAGGGALPQQLDVLPGDLFDQTLLTGRYNEIANLQQEPRAGTWQSLGQRYKIQGTLLLPIRHRHQSRGILLVGSSLWGGHPRADDLTELEMLTNALGECLGSISGPTATVTPQQDFGQRVTGLERLVTARTPEQLYSEALAEIQQVIQPARACLYWLDFGQQSCKLLDVQGRSQGRRKGTAKTVPHVEATFQEIGSFYQQALQGHTIAISDIKGVVQAQIAPTRLMQLAKTQAWLSAPIFDQNQQVVGLLVAEEDQPRIWNDADQQYIQLLGRLVTTQVRSLTAASEQAVEFGASLERSTALLRDYERDELNWYKALQSWLELLAQRYGARWTGLLDYDEINNFFRCDTQFYQKKKQPLPFLLPELSEVDAKLLRRGQRVLPISEIGNDLRLLNWRPIFADIGIKSYVLAKTAEKSGFGPIILMGSDLPRTWTEQEIDSIEHLAQELGQSLYRSQLWQQMTAQYQSLGLLKQGLQLMQQHQRSDQILQAAAHAIQQFLGVQCVVILSWSPEQPNARVTGFANESALTLDPTVAIAWQTDGLINALQHQLLHAGTEPDSLASPKALVLGAEEWADLTQGWLTGTASGAAYGMSLQPHLQGPSYGMVIAISSVDYRWSADQDAGVVFLVGQAAQMHQAEIQQQQLDQWQQQLERLNWYKQRHVERFCSLWETLEPAITTGEEPPLVRGQRGVPAIDQLRSGFTQLETILKQESWQLQIEPESIVLATLLRRVLAQIESVTQERQLWTQVHNLTPNVSLFAPAAKLELVVTELLLAACHRAQIRGRIDIWCRALEEEWVELSITDQGRLNPKLLQALQNPRNTADKQLLKEPPGVHFKICRDLIEDWGGQFTLAQLEDGRAISRILLSSSPQIS